MTVMKRPRNVTTTTKTAMRKGPKHKTVRRMKVTSATKTVAATRMTTIVTTPGQRKRKTTKLRRTTTTLR